MFITVKLAINQEDTRVYSNTLAKTDFNAKRWTTIYKIEDIITARSNFQKPFLFDLLRIRKHSESAAFHLTEKEAYLYWEGRTKPGAHICLWK